MYGPRLCKEYMDGVHAFIENAKKIWWTMVDSIFIAHARIAKMRRDIFKRMC
jgi:hypothetical protein